jgi:hypothetical protein
VGQLIQQNASYDALILLIINMRFSVIEDFPEGMFKGVIEVLCLEGNDFDSRVDH